MKKTILSLVIVLCFGIVKAQYFYNDKHNAICKVQIIQEEAFDVYCGGIKVAFVKYDIVYNGSGIKIGVVKEDILYDDLDNVICIIKRGAFYSGGNKVAFVKNDIVYDGVGNRIVAVSGISMMQIAIYIFLIAN
jgi:hypothetical protein